MKRSSCSGRSANIARHGKNLGTFLLGVIEVHSP